MEELKYLNVKEFSYRISINSDISNIYDEKIESLRSKIINIKEEIYLMEQLISLSDEEIKEKFIEEVLIYYYMKEYLTNS